MWHRSLEHGQSPLNAPGLAAVEEAVGVAKAVGTAVFDGNPAPVKRTNIAGSGKSVAFKYVTNDSNAAHSIQGLVITFGVGDRL